MEFKRIMAVRTFVSFQSPKGLGRAIMDLERLPVTMEEIEEVEATIAGQVRSQGIVLVGMTALAAVQAPVQVQPTPEAASTETTAPPPEETLQ
jgi:hypothetical protein